MNLDEARGYAAMLDDDDTPRERYMSETIRTLAAELDALHATARRTRRQVVAARALLDILGPSHTDPLLVEAVKHLALTLSPAPTEREDTSG